MKSYALFITTLLTGLSAGLFYAWSVSVIPGTRKITDVAYLETMQSINRAIINPWFLVIFLAPLLCFTGSAYLSLKAESTEVFTMILVAGLIYLIGTVGVTAAGNVPLNEGLDKVILADQSPISLKEIREGYEIRWNRLHLIRTVFSVLSFCLCLVSMIMMHKH